MKQFFIIERTNQDLDQEIQEYYQELEGHYQEPPYFVEMKTNKDTKQRYSVWTDTLNKATKFSDPNHATNAAIECTQVDNGTPETISMQRATLPEKPWAYKITAFFQ